MGVKFAKFYPPSVQRVAPAGRKTSNRPLSKLNTGRFALRAMLPVMNNNNKYVHVQFYQSIAAAASVAILSLNTLNDARKA